ncbi:MAG: DUF4251 domain-containing protein [Tidjanibacter sp.]|nr:DUF4251 domain-containing protein [Tidjanibacter sp.]
MKKILLLFAIVATLATLVVPLVVTSNTPTETGTSFEADRQREEQLSEKHRERIARRKARQAAYERFIDSTILSHNYRFVPTMFNAEPAGSSNIITNPNIELAIYNDWADIHLPVYQGFTPPYRLVIINTTITNLADFTTVQTDDGWTISFDSWLYSSNDYTFTLDVYSKTGGATLTLSSTFYPTTTYWGSIVAVY